MERNKKEVTERFIKEAIYNDKRLDKEMQDCTFRPVTLSTKKKS